MKKKHVLSILLIAILIGLFALGAFSKGIQHKYQIDIQAPISKSYNNIASHELKSLIYPQLDVQRSLVHPHVEGDSTILFMKNENSYVKEIILKKDSLRFYSFIIETENDRNHIEITFKDLGRISRLNISERLQSKSILDKAMLILMKSAWKKNRQKFYQKLKNYVESTPDYNFQPEEQK